MDHSGHIDKDELGVAAMYYLEEEHPEWLVTREVGAVLLELLLTMCLWQTYTFFGRICHEYLLPSMDEDVEGLVHREWRLDTGGVDT